MAEPLSAAVDQAVLADLISFLKIIPDGRYRRGVRYHQWFLLLVTVLGILSGCRSSRDLEAFARRHREQLNQAMGLTFKRWPPDATFLYLFNKAHLPWLPKSEIKLCCLSLPRLPAPAFP